MAKKKKSNPRIITLTALLLVVMLAFGVRMSDFQLINADEYASEGDNISTRTATIKATRGELLDRYGRPIAVNREGYDVVFNGAYMNKGNMNSTIKTMTELLVAYGFVWIDTLPMDKNSPYDFTIDSDSVVSTLKSDLGLTHYATAQNCFVEMISRYSLEGLNESAQRTIMGVRYSMESADFSISLPFTFAEDVSSELMTVILESESSLPGVEIQVSSYREYVDDTLAVHLIGSVGKIQAKKWEKLKAAGYSYDDKVGNGGVEEAFEDYLRGDDGTFTYKVDGSGNILSSTITTAPINGETVKLSIDKRLQIVAQNELKAAVDSYNSKGGKITGAAAVAVDVNTGEVLASANYPSYTLSEFKNNYSALAADTSKPLFDRAFNGQYPPGSVFKPSVA
ncbi:MAG: penicillin-binding transpeptidase domain-containing protein, partial [Oscillospiraceae bacterium]|nr:penicillin-binding transpeptidase domain-containing protein [Oscillospiraceae bacterium]